MKQFETRIELLNDTIAYYWGKPERRCVNSIGNCCYLAPTNSQSEGCAIGRLISKELAHELDNDPNQQSAVTYSHIFNRLPEWMQNLGENFLSSLQMMHDYKSLELCDKDEVLGYVKDYVNVDEIVFPN